MAFSMTGFGTAEVKWDTWSCITEIRSVNHRFLDVSCRIPSSFQKIEQELKNNIKSLCSRGKIDCNIKMEKDTGGNELNVLKGAEKLLSKKKIMLIYVEISESKDKFDEKEKSVIDFLSSYNFVIKKKYQIKSCSFMSNLKATDNLFLNKNNE